VDDSPGARPLSDDRPVVTIVPRDVEATIVLLRHGESTAIVEGRFQGQLDTPLSETGRRQATLAARRLARPNESPALPVPDGPPVEIIHSPLARAAETAAAVATAIAGDDGFDAPVPVRADAGFSEIGQGDWEGLPATEVVERWGALLSAWHADPVAAWAPGGESLPLVQARVRPALDSVVGGLVTSKRAAPRLPSQLVTQSRHAIDGPWSLVVAHDGVFKIVLLTLFGLSLDRFWTFPFALCGISIVELLDGRARLRAHNLTDHLAPLLEERAQEISEERERLGAL
jgi:broad specificity phosphatase PhoE